MKADKENPKLEGILPWTHSCFVCGENNKRGLHLKSYLKDGKVFIKFAPDESLLGYRHIIHGGIAMTLLDEVMTWAAIAYSNKACVSAEICCRFKAPIAKDTKLIIEGKVIEEKRKIIITEGRIIAEADEAKCFVVASGKYVPMAESDMMLCQKDFVVSQESIPPSEILKHTK